MFLLTNWGLEFVPLYNAQQANNYIHLIEGIVT